ncbi:MAG: hypothetical protein COX19_05960, partial [Desulfobacterales bacterium CG23_combo_of_CG06-09_8_20_14_all_51_8]
GTPTAAGTFTFTITATDANGCTGLREYTLVINPAACPPITLSPRVLPAGTVNRPYSQTITAGGGLAPYAFTMTSGTLPTGLSPITSAGLIAGTPTVAGTFTFTITATDANGCAGLREYTIYIPPYNPPSPPNPPNPPGPAKLGLLKLVNGGTASATDFILTATGDVSTGSTIVTGTTPVSAVDVPAGVYIISESGPDGYIATFSVTGGGTLDANILTITEADEDKTITVTITNEFTPAIAAKIGLIKTVTGGTASIGDFTLTATGGASTGPTVVTGKSPVTAVNVPVGVYTITETGPAGYTAAFSVTGGGTLIGNKLTITEADEDKTITVTISNTFTAIPTLSEWGMIICIILLGLTSIYYMKKREVNI